MSDSIVPQSIGSTERPQFIDLRLPPLAEVVVADNAIVDASFAVDITTVGSALESKKKWRDKGFRHAYAVAAVEQGIAWQCRINREKRNLSQNDLAKIIGTKQSSISRMEDPEYGSHSLPTLLKVAEAFDCALLVKFVPFSVLAAESKCLSERSLYAQTYSEEVGDNG